jgi:hypothetical protein
VLVNDCPLGANTEATGGGADQLPLLVLLPPPPPLLLLLSCCDAHCLDKCGCLEGCFS